MERTKTSCNRGSARWPAVCGPTSGRATAAVDDHRHGFLQWPIWLMAAATENIIIKKICNTPRTSVDAASGASAGLAGGWMHRRLSNEAGHDFLVRPPPDHPPRTCPGLQFIPPRVAAPLANHPHVPPPAADKRQRPTRDTTTHDHFSNDPVPFLGFSVNRQVFSAFILFYFDKCLGFASTSAPPIPSRLLTLCRPFIVHKVHELALNICQPTMSCF